MQANFSQAFALVKQQFIQVINSMDSIKLFGNFSILEFFIALLVLGGILPIVIITISNRSNNALSASVRADRRSEIENYRNEKIQYYRSQGDYYRSHLKK